MAPTIRYRKAKRLAAELAKATGETKTEAVIKAKRARLPRERRKRLADELDEIALHCAALPIRDQRSPDQIIYGLHP